MKVSQSIVFNNQFNIFQYLKRRHCSWWRLNIYIS